MDSIIIRDFINGAFVDDGGAPRIPLYNPSTGAVIGSVPDRADPGTLERALATAHEAYDAWRRVPVAKRVTYVYALREAMVRRFEELARAIALDQAKHIVEARAEVQRVVEIVEAACCTPATIQGDILDQVSNTVYAKVVRQSLGVFGGLAPFNFPGLVFGWFVPYAIAAGDTIIFKPSPQSPYFMQLICEIFMDIGLPAGVVNVVHGGREVADSWYEDDRIAGVCFVGSTPTAKAIAAGCARGGKRSMLLGGAKNIIYVATDADMDVFVTRFVNSCYGCGGQRCLAGSIVAADAEIYEEVVERIVEASARVKIGDALDPDVEMGPLISREAVQRVHDSVDLALSHGQGCRMVLDRRQVDLPEANRGGFFVGPVIIRDITPCNPVFTTEIFGPLVGTIKVSGMQEALRLVNGSKYGNGAYIYTQNMYRAETFSREAASGMVGVNVALCAPHPYVPFGGAKDSLIGTNKTQGKNGLDFFTQQKITTYRVTPPRDEAGAAAPDAAVCRSCVAG